MPDIGTLESTTNPDGMVYSEGKGILISTASVEMETCAFKAIRTVWS